MSDTQTSKIAVVPWDQNPWTATSTDCCLMPPRNFGPIGPLRVEGEPRPSGMCLVKGSAGLGRKIGNDDIKLHLSCTDGCSFGGGTMGSGMEAIHINAVLVADGKDSSGCEGGMVEAAHCGGIREGQQSHQSGMTG